MADGYQTREEVAGKVDWEAAYRPFAAAEAEVARLLEEALGEVEES